jgi:hypothetical protein
MTWRARWASRCRPAGRQRGSADPLKERGFRANFAFEIPSNPPGVFNNCLPGLSRCRPQSNPGDRNNVSPDIAEGQRDVVHERTTLSLPVHMRGGVAVVAGFWGIKGAVIRRAAQRRRRRGASQQLR